MKETLNNPRAEIDAIDIELLRLLNSRAAIALKVGEAKRHVDTSLCDPNREQEVIARLSQQNQGPLTDQSITSIFQRIMDECLHIQQRTFHQTTEDKGQTKLPLRDLVNNSRVAFLGERGTFSEEAVLALSSKNCEPVSCPTFEDLFAAIKDERADYILAPLENTLVGSVHRCYDLLLESSLSIVGEVILPISHYLIACPGATLASLETVESHPAALAQCERFFAAYPNLKRVAAADTASSVRRVVESKDLSKAAIAGKRTADIYGGVILQEHVEDSSENYTRFGLLAAHPNESADGHKISLVIKLTHRPGALHDALTPFVRRGIDLLKIESRPIKGQPWQYNFYLDLAAPASKSEMRGALEQLTTQAAEVRYLGRYSSIEIANNDSVLNAEQGN